MIPMSIHKKPPCSKSSRVRILARISKNSPLAIKYAIQSITSGLNTNYFNSFDIENNLFSNLFESYDSKEGIDAFINKRKGEPEEKN